MAGFMSNANADELLSRGVISPEQHSAILAANGPAPMSPAAPMAMPEPPPAPEPMAMNTPAQPPPGGLEGIYRGIGDVVSAPNFGAQPAGAPPMAPPPPAGPPAPVGNVEVGPITTSAPAPAMTPKAPVGVPSVDPRMAALKRDEGFAQERIGSVEREGEAATSRANEALAASQAYAQSAKDQAVLDAKAAADEAEAANSAASDKRKAIADYAAAKVDPGRWWHSRSTAQKTAGLIGVALGGFAEGLSGGRVQNRALEAIYRGIDQDIRAQEGEIAKKGAIVQQKGSLFSDMLQLTGSKQAARSAARLVKLQDLQVDLDVAEKKYGAAVAPERANQMRVGIQKELSDETARLQTTLRNEAAARTAAARKHVEERDKELFRRGEVTTKLAQDQDRINIDRKRADTEARRSTPEQVKAAAEDAALRKDMEEFNLAWDTSVKTNYGSRPTAFLGSLFATDNNSLHQGGQASLTGITKGPHDNSDTDQARVATMTPQPGDDEATLARKKALAYAKIASNHPEAFERMGSRKVPTSAPPGSKK